MTTASAVPPIDEVILITTADVTGGREAELTRLFESVEAFRANRPDVRVRHYMLLQRCADVEAGKAQIGTPASMIVTAVDRQVPLSIARNMMLAEVLATPLSAASIVAFPDDDAWYPAGTLEHVVSRFAAQPALDLWFCRYGSDARWVSGAEERKPRFQDVLSYASSNTTIVRGTLLNQIRGFDEQLGLGTAAKSGEDTDYAIRAYFGAREARYSPEKMIGHRDYTPAYRARYYSGATIAITRNAHRSVPAFVAFVRKVAVGLVLTARGEMKPGEFARPFTARKGAARP